MANFLVIAGVILYSLGELYWLFLSFDIGSFLMFALGLIPLTAPFAGFVGAWSLMFDVPHWVYSCFG